MSDTKGATGAKGKDDADGDGTLDYTLKSLLEQAVNDESWEPDRKKRERFVAELDKAMDSL